MSIVVQGVTKFYGDQKALDNVTFEVKTGEIVGFLGPNGAGKSTMMKIITGYIPASLGISILLMVFPLKMKILKLKNKSVTCLKIILFILKCT